MKKLNKIYEWLLYAMPVVLFFSFWPAITFGQSDTMHYKITMPLIWLVIFDIVSIVLFFQKKLLKKIFSNYLFLLFPIFATISLIWSQNRLRGLFMVGVLCLIMIAIYSIILLKKEYMGDVFKKKFLKVFFGASMFVCAFCLLQCVLDLVNVSRDVTLMCEGCIYEKFGFPHPNGFAIEPQFMGNLLLAPTLLAGYLSFKNRKYLYLFFILTASLFLTFSRGAIYAFILAVFVYTAVKVIREKKWQTLLLWPVIILAFLFTLNLQGLFAQFSGTNDTYFSGIAKVINHLSLGKIEIRAPKNGGADAASEPVEKQESIFDGYVEESTETRLNVTTGMLKTWASKPTSILFGVGFGGAGVAMHETGNLGYPGEVGHNFYASTLLETGLLGALLFGVAVIMAIMRLWKTKGKEFVLTLVFAYGITLLFFAGYVNAVHVFLLPVFFTLYFESVSAKHR